MERRREHPHVYRLPDSGWQSLPERADPVGKDCLSELMRLHSTSEYYLETGPRRRLLGVFPRLASRSSRLNRPGFTGGR